MLESVGLPVAGFLLPVIGMVVTALLIWGGRKLLKKYNMFNADIDAKLQEYVKIGVDYAERWARNKFNQMGTKPPSSDKLGVATQAVLNELEKSGIKQVGVEIIQARIESWLEERDGEPGKTTASG